MRALERVRVLVERDTSTKIPVSVWDYELRILAAIHGGEALFEESRKSEKVEWDAQTAHETLRRKYGDNVTFNIYPTVGSLASAVDPARKTRQESPAE